MNGILLLALGTVHQRLVPKFCHSARPHTSLPIHILTNSPLRPNLPKDTTWEIIPRKPSESRFVKTQLFHYTPFSSTLFFDTDSEILSPSINELFSCLSSHPPLILTHPLETYTNNPPFPVHTSSFFGFNTDAQEFFQTWHRQWSIFNHPRDMPAFNTAIQTMAASIGYLQLPKEYWGYRETHEDNVVRHIYPPTYPRKKELWKPPATKGEWTRVEWDAPL
jgi:hypothetical protein